MTRRDTATEAALALLADPTTRRGAYARVAAEHDIPEATIRYWVRAARKARFSTPGASTPGVPSVGLSPDEGEEKTKPVPGVDESASGRLWGAEEHECASDSTEFAIIEALEVLNAAKPFDAVAKAQATICRSLARNIDAGNSKGRAVANEANQLRLILLSLRPDSEGSTVDDLPADARRLLDALGSAPRFDSAPVRDAS